MNDYSGKKLSIVIPVYNEERTMEVLLGKVTAVKLPFKKEIIIVNDGSKDASAEIIKKFISENSSDENEFRFFEKANGGKGSAVKRGIAESTGDVLIIQDADLEYDPNDYLTCVRPILDGECKVVYGSREAANRNRLYSSPCFYLGALSLTFWINLLFNSNLTDEPTCYKTFDGNLIRSVPIEGDKFDWEPEITAKLLRLGYEIREVPIAYFPRKVSEGKKIKSQDGLDAFVISLKWRFRSLSDTASKLCSLSDADRKTVTGARYARIALISVFFLALAIRLAYAMPGLSDPETLMRPDSITYINPAKALVSDFAFSTEPGSEEPAMLRTPGYPLFLASIFFISGGSLKLCIIASAVIGALICIPIFLCGNLFSSWKAGFIASLLFALNPTAIALSPMFLSDTLFALFIALQVYFFLRFAKSTFGLYFFMSVAIAAVAAYIRPVNILWIFPALFVVFFVTGIPFRLRTTYAALGLLLFVVIVSPWVVRNKLNDGGWRFNAVSGDALRHSAAALTSSMTGENGENIRQRYQRDFELEFASDPVKYKSYGARTSYQEKKMTEIILEHPFRYFLLHIRPLILIPDMASFLENLGLSTGGKGTWDVINTKGVMAGARHYFEDKMWLPSVVSPLIAVVGITYLACGFTVIMLFIRKNVMGILLFLLLAEYYLFLPGPVAMPRYQLPALPLICLGAAWGILFIYGKIRKKPFPDSSSLF